MRNEEVYDAIQELRRTGEPAVLATVVGVKGSSPGALGAKMLVTPDGRTWGTVGGGCVDGQVFAELGEVLRSERPRRFSATLTESDDPDHGLICGGIVEVFLEPVVTTHLIVCGSGHVAHALAPLASKLDFQVTVLDDRPQFLNAERFPQARLLLGEFQQVLAELEAPPGSFIAIVTRGHRHDEECLEWALSQRDPRYVGLIGSRTKLGKIVGRLREKGFSEDMLLRLRSPIGLDIGSLTVDEIAVSIAAELVAVRRRGIEISRDLRQPGAVDPRHAKLAAAPLFPRERTPQPAHEG